MKTQKRTWILRPTLRDSGSIPPTPRTSLHSFSAGVIDFFVTKFHKGRYTRRYEAILNRPLVVEPEKWLKSCGEYFYKKILSPALQPVFCRTSIRKELSSHFFSAVLQHSQTPKGESHERHGHSRTETEVAG